MKKLLSIIGAITLVGTSTTSLVACNTPQQEYTKEELEHLKKENQINTADETIKNNLEWMAPQEKPFNEVDNKWYYVVCRGDKNNNWEIKKVKNIKQGKNEILFKDEVGILYPAKILSVENYNSKYMKNYFKSVYRWNLDTKEPDLILDNNGNLKINGE